MFLTNKNINFRIRRSKVTDYAALIDVSEAIRLSDHNSTQTYFSVMFSSYGDTN